MTHVLYQDLIKKGLPHAFPAAPRITSKHGMYFMRNGENVAFHNFAATYSAHYFLDMVLKDLEYSWINDNEIETDSGITIRGESDTDLEDIMSHDYSRLEKEFMMPHPYQQFAALIRGEPASTPIVINSPTNITPATPKPATPKRRKSSVRKKRIVEGVTTLANIAQELSVNPRDARQALRKSSITKPEGGWQWPSDDAKSIEAVKKLLKSL